MTGTTEQRGGGRMEIGSKVGAEGWTVVHEARQKHYNDRFYGQFLGTRTGPTGRTEWIVGRQHVGRSMEDGLCDGGWAWSRRFAEDRSTDTADAALKAYVDDAQDTFVWDRIFEQRIGEAIDRHWAGAETAGAPKLSAGWHRTDPGPSQRYGSHTIFLPLHEARYQLLQMLRSTELNAMAHLTEGVTLDRHQAVETVTQATRPVRFEYGYNTYWLTAE
ncbi:hypothetical protein [Streptomyces sp. NPDC001089]